MKSTLRNTLYFLSLTPAIAVIYGNLHGGWMTGLNVCYSLVLLGLSEWLFPQLMSNEHAAKEAVMPNVVVFLHLPFQLAAIASIMLGITQGQIQPEFIGLSAFSTGLNSGSSAIVVAHELIHRKSKAWRLGGKLLLFTAGNVYFYIEHLKVHHKLVGTDADPASAKLNENLYQFFLRSSRGQIRGAYALERKRLPNASRFSLKNELVRQVALQLAFGVALFLLFGGAVLAGWLVQCLIANFLLEYVNYIQHYGLRRQVGEKLGHHHSWDTGHFVSRFVLVDLARHSDHHTHATKPYHQLEQHVEAPMLPSGYAGLFFLAAIPPVWFKVMNPKLQTA